MLTEYVQAALNQAEVKRMEDGSWWGVIPGFNGLWADGGTEAECRAELESALEDWIVFGLQRQAQLPVVEGIDLTVHDVA
jgi:predicted RNase H-like HicB family nuclease